jgi:hypothetical protein
MPEKITESQYEEIADAENSQEEFIKLLEEHTGIIAKPYTAYVYYDPCENYIGCSEVQTLREVLEEAEIEVVADA